MGKLKIKNRKERKIVVVVEKPKNPTGLAIVMHGLSGNKDQSHIATFAEAFKQKNYITVRFDTTNTFGESDGRYEDATLTNYYQDLEDVISWAKKQSWYVEPFVLAGHSFGGISIILYAEKHPNEIKGLAPISTVISGKLSMKAPQLKKLVPYWKKTGSLYVTVVKSTVLEIWKKTGWREEKSESVLGRTKKLPWSHMLDRLKYDVLPNAKKLKMPVLLIVGDKDQGTPLKHQKLLYNKLPDRKELHVIKGAPHTFVKPKHLAEIKQIFLRWIDLL